GELDALPLLPPAVYVVLAGVVGGEGGPLVAVLVQQGAQGPRAAPRVALRVVEGGEADARAARVHRDSLRGRRQELHQPDRARARARVRVELALLVDHPGKEGGVEVVVARMPAHDRLVAEGVAKPDVPAGLGRVDVRERSDERGAGEEDEEELLHSASGMSAAITSPTKASRSASEPSFT